MNIDNALDYEGPNIIGNVEARWLRDSILEALGADLTDESRECFIDLLNYAEDALNVRD